MGSMQAALMLWAFLGVRAYAAPDPAVLMRFALPPGFEPAPLEVPVFVPVPMPVLMMDQFAGDTQTVALAPLLDRHLYRTDTFVGAAG